MAQAVEYLPSKHKALSSNQVLPRKKTEFILIMEIMEF
jgi:hypothetical protein